MAEAELEKPPVDPDETIAPEVTEVSGDWIERAMDKHAIEHPDGVTDSKSPDRPPVDTPPTAVKPVVPEVKPVVTDEKPPEPVKKIEPPQDAEDLKKFLEEKPISKLSEKASHDFNRIKESSVAMIRARDETIRKANEELAASKKIIADMNGQMGTLKKLQAVVDYQTDPEFVAKYEKPISEKEAEMADWLKSIGVDEAGLAEFAKGKKSDTFLADVGVQISEKNPGMGELFRQHMMELRVLRRSHANAVKDVQTNHEKFFEERKNASSVKRAEFSTQIETALTEAIAMKLEDGKTPKLNFITKMEIPVTASAEQKKQIETHNDNVEKNLKTVREWAMSDDPQTRMNNAIGMMAALIGSNHIMPKMEAYIAELEKQLQAFKGATRIPNKSSATPGEAPPAKAKNWDDAFSEIGYSDKV